MGWVGPITLYAHEEEEEWAERTKEIVQESPHLPKELVAALLIRNSLYEVEFTYYVDEETQQYYCTRVKWTNDGLMPSLERPLPDQASVARGEVRSPSVDLGEIDWVELDEVMKDE